MEISMKNGTCPKCGSADIRFGEANSGGDHKLLGNAGFKTVYSNIYVCAQCGFVEDYVDGEDLERIRQKWPGRP
jgi:predicted RNA-binding Zn-ribbon protein involved in translation (DUF1610 family)